MKYSTVVTALLCAEAVMGAKFTQKRRESREARKIAKRAGGTRSSRPIMKLDDVETNNTNVEYSSNWAGAVITSTGWTEVTGTVTVPTLTTSSSSRTESAGSAVSPHYICPI